MNIFSTANFQINRNYQLPTKKYTSDVDIEFKTAVSNRLYNFFSEPENENEERVMISEFDSFVSETVGITEQLRKDTQIYFMKSFQPILGKISFYNYMYCAGVSNTNCCLCKQI